MRKTMAALVLSALVLVLSGCVFTKPEASLYRLPKLSGEYESLESQIDALLSSGAEYAAPTSGSNLQSVQMIDLDGDGEEEAVAFFRRANDKKPMKIYIFKAAGDNYERYAVIEGTSNQIYSVNYADLDGDGRKEILVGYKSSSDVQGLSIYSLSPGTPEPLLITGYSRYANLDMDGDGKQELLIICSDEESGARVDYYNWDEGVLRAKSSLRLSSSVAGAEPTDGGDADRRRKGAFCHERDGRQSDGDGRAGAAGRTVAEHCLRCGRESGTRGADIPRPFSAR